MSKQPKESRLTRGSAVWTSWFISPESALTISRARATSEAAEWANRLSDVRFRLPIIRPAVMFGLQDAFLGPIANLLRRLPVFPMFGRGQTNLQPAYVEDVAQAVGRVLESSEARMTYELGGPHTYTYENLLRTIAHHLHVKRILFPVPFALWQAMAFAAELLPNPPVTRNQVELMKIDNVAAAEMPGFSTLFIESRSVEEVLPRIIRPS
jgi:NADH dehydrogenase